MSSREDILNRLKNFQNNEKLEIIDFDSDEVNLVERFTHNATLAGAEVFDGEDNIKEVIQRLFLKDDIFIYESSLGVAENGALWCSDLGKERKELFLTNELIIKIKKSNIRSNMHQAYKEISFENREFGTFIAGPSKTADIEQSLVIGAHGAMKLYILLLED